MTEYVYHSRDDELESLEECFESRIGDNSGHHEEEYFDILKLLIAMNNGGSLLDIGAGFGRVTRLAQSGIAESIALEPDVNRWRQSHAVYHNPPQTQILCQLSSQYIHDNPGKKFDIVVIGAVLQHLSTTRARDLLCDMTQLMKPEGVGLILTTHCVEPGKVFTLSKIPPNQNCISEQFFNEYAESSGDESMGLPVHRFSKKELRDYLEPHFKICLWRQVSYYKESKVRFFENRFRLPPGTLKDVGNSQFAVVMKK